MRPIDQLTRRTFPFAIDQHGNLHSVPIVHVVRNELEMPFQFAGIGIERDGAVGIEVVAGPRIAVPVGRRIAGTPDDQVLGGSKEPVSQVEPPPVFQVLPTQAQAAFLGMVQKRQRRFPVAAS